MGKLTISLMGPFQADLDGQTLTDFRSDKTRALLAFLVVEANYPWTRTYLADLLWPDFSERKAQSNLRNALWNLRHVLLETQEGPHFITVNKSTIQFNPNSDHKLDIQTFDELLESVCPDQQQLGDNRNLAKLEEYLLSNRNSFIEDIQVGSPAFETWVLKTRQQIHQKRIHAYRCITRIHRQSGALSAAYTSSQKWIELDPWEEAAYRESMRILIALGRPNAAISLFEKCKNLLRNDLGIEPQTETMQLYQEITNGENQQKAVDYADSGPLQRKRARSSESLSQTLVNTMKEVTDSAPFYARQKELNQLDQWLKKSVQGYGRVGFIIGEPGSGKSYLMAEFIRRALKKVPNLLIFKGHCNAYTGQGDPYFPFMNFIRMFAGELAALGPGAIINKEHLDRLWQYMPQTITSLLEAGPGLIQRFLSEHNTLPIIEQHPGFSPADIKAVNSFLKSAQKQSGQQIPINDQFSQVLTRLAEDNPIMLILDDLQWIDDGSAGLLFHLGRQISGKRIFILGAFRPEEVFLEQAEDQHLLVGIYQELQATYGEIIIDLMKSDGQPFVNELLASEPNKFNTNFNKMIYQLTSGHPLFTIELLRGMQLRHEIIQDNQGDWVEGGRLDWNVVPARVEAVIARRFGSLPESCHPLIAPACIQGEIFSVEVIASILGKPFEEVFELLNENTCKQHQLIKFHSIHQAGENQITYFQFRHVLFQIYLYKGLNDAEKIRLHSQAGEVLEKFYQNNLSQYPEMAHNLARHFELANQMEKAVTYYTLAGKNAVSLTANQEALRHYYHALKLIKDLPHSEKRDELELDIQVSLAPPLTMAIGHGAPEIEKAYARAEVLCENIKDEGKILPFLWLFKSFRLGRAEHAEADRLFDRITRIARKTDDPALQALCALQVTKFYQGKFKESKILLERAALWNDVNLQRFVAQKFGMAPAVVALCHLYNCLWVMGFLEKASETNNKAFKLAYAIEHPISIAYVACRACWVGGLKNNIAEVQSNADMVYNLASKFGSEIFEHVAWFWKNWACFHQNGMKAEFLDGMEAGMEGYYGTHSKFNRPAFLGFFAEACLQAGEFERCSKMINESIRIGEENKEFWYQAESWRIKGELLLAKNNGNKLSTVTVSEVETCFKNAYIIARHLSAKSFELRATINLARLGLTNGRSKKAFQMLAKTYAWFSEGFDTPDLIEARKLLESQK